MPNEETSLSQPDTGLFSSVIRGYIKFDQCGTKGESLENTLGPRSVSGSNDFSAFAGEWLNCFHL